MMDEAESSGFKEMSVDDWNKLRRLAKSKLAKWSREVRRPWMEFDRKIL